MADRRSGGVTDHVSSRPHGAGVPRRDPAGPPSKAPGRGPSGFAGVTAGNMPCMTISGGAGSESGGSRQEAKAPEDADPGLPAATGPLAAGGPQTGDVQGGGPMTESVEDQAPQGQGSAEGVESPSS